MRTCYYQNPSDYVKSTSNQPSQEIVTTRVCVELGVIKNGTDKGDMAEPPAIISYCVNVEPCSGNVELNEVTLKTVSESHKPSVTEADYSNSIKDDSDKNAVISTVTNESVDKNSNNSPVNSLVKSNGNGSDVLEKISHDLDYLLNRTQDGNVVPSDTFNYQRKSLLNNIKEEDEELSDKITTKKSGLIAKTSL